MKRKHASSAPIARTANNGKSKQLASKPQPQLQQRQKQPQKPQQFAQPMRRLMDDSDSDDEDQNHEAAQYDRRHMDEINQDAEIEDEDDLPNDHDAEDSDDSPNEEVEEEDDEVAQEEDGDENDEEMNDPQDDDDGHDDAAEEAASSAALPPPLEIDLPIQLVLGTYSGVLYGLKSHAKLREVQKYHMKLHSKRGIEETDMKQDEMEDDDQEDGEEQEEQEDEANEEEKMNGTTAKSTSTPAVASSSTAAFDILFTNIAHIGSMKSLAISADGKWMVTGGMDETIKIYQTSKMREFGQLHSHSGSISTLEFYGSSFLLSGGQEGDLCIWNTKSWQLLRKFTGAHQGTPGSIGGVSSVGVHPSGRVALSVGAVDRKVKLWDLMKGTMASERKLDFACIGVKWNTEGEMYVLLGDKRFDIYDTASTLIRREEVTDTKLLSVVWLSSSLVAFGCEDKSIRVHDAKSGACVTILHGHQARVRGLDVLTVPLSSDESSRHAVFLASASTDGQTYLWDLSSLTPTSTPTTYHPCCSTFHDQRVTMLRVLPQYQARKDDVKYIRPVQTTAAQQKQQELMKKKAVAAAAASSNGDASSKPANRARAQEEKGKKLFEKNLRKHERELAATKAKKQLARLNPMVDGGDEEEEQQPRKKQKQEFEVAPLVESDDEQQEDERKNGGEDDEEDEEEVPIPPKAASKKPPTKPTAGKLQQKPQSVASSVAKSAAKSASSSAKNVKSKPTAASASSSSHSGFSASIPLFKPQLNQQRKKKQSAKKIQRDADRKRSQQQQGR